MIGLREDQRERVQLVGKINALFAQLRDGLVVVGGLAVANRPVVANGLVVASGLAPRWAAQQP
jgi:hypothetical protein